MIGILGTGAVAIATVLAVWGASLAVIHGLGCFATKILCHRQPVRLEPASLCATGYVVAIALLQTWHLFAPVDGRALATLLLLAAAGEVVRQRDHGWVRPRLREGIVLVGFAVWCADLALGACDAYDSANYHLTAIHWYNSFPVVRGLGNLYTLTAINLPGLLWTSLFETGLGATRSQHFANGAIVVMTAYMITWRVARLLPSGIVRPSSIAAAVLLYPTVNVLNRAHWLTSPVTDCAPLMIAICATILLLEGLEETNRVEAGQRQGLGLALLALLAILKPTIAVFSFLTWSTYQGLLLRRYGAGQFRRTLQSICIASALFVPWIATNILISGYPLFPASVAPMPVDWRVPAIYADGTRLMTQAYARMPDGFARFSEAFQGWSWLRYWARIELRSALSEIIVPTAVAILGLFLVVAATPINGRRVLRDERAALFLATLLALVWWFFSAPLARYGEPSFWALAAIVSAWATAALKTAPSNRRLGPSIAFACLVLPLVQAVYYRVRTERRASNPHWLSSSIEPYFQAPGSDHGFHPLPAPPPMDAIPICGGITVNVPHVRQYLTASSQWREMLIWSAPLPATPRLDNALCLRTPFSLADGFKSNPSPNTWQRDHAQEVLEIAESSSWSAGRLATFFLVPLSAIDEILQKHPEASPELTSAAHP